MAKKILPIQFKTHLIEQLIESVSEDANTSYYSFVGDHISSGETEQEIIQPDSSYNSLSIETYRNMIFGKRLSQNDMKFVIQRYDWIANTIFAKYDDEDINLFNKNFYTVTDEGEFKHVYKCLNNANNSPSTAQPVFNDITTDDFYYESSDGYLWKYMYSINSVDFAKFSTQKFIPVIANNDVQAAAVPGTIDVIKIQTDERFGSTISLNGKNYNNYLTNVLFTDADVTVGNTVQYRIPSTASTVRGFYGNTIIHITSGTGAGQYKRVIDSYLNQNLGGIFIEVDSAFDINPDSTSRYELSPEVKVFGNGTETIKAVARAIINANASNSIHRVEMLSIGQNYNYATATVLTGVPASAQGTSTGDLVIPTPAFVKPIIPPNDGHGANSASELGAKTLCIYTKYLNDEGNTIPTQATFAQFGILRDPLFSNVEISYTKLSDGLSGSDGSFVLGEKIYQLKILKLNGTVSVTANDALIECEDSNMDYSSFIESGQYVYITNTSSPVENIVAEVDFVIDDNKLFLKKSSVWGAANCDIYVAKINAVGFINDIASSSSCFLNRVLGIIKSNEIIVGDFSGAAAKVSNVNINSKLQSPANYDFNTFTQYVRCIGTIVGTFENNELVYQGNTLTPTMTARVHSFENNELRLTQLDGQVNTAVQIFGQTSEAVMFSGFDKYNGDLDPTSGSVIYLQNEIPITRNSNRSEEIRVILEF
jgi:hypothetical protein